MLRRFRISRIWPVLVLAAAVAGCGRKPAPAQPAPVAAPSDFTATSRPADEPPQQLTAAQKLSLESTFGKARALVEQARKLRQAGEEIERTQGRQAANDSYKEAKGLYRDALEMTEEWIEPDLRKVTQRQVDTLLASYVRERGAWAKEVALMGKIHD